MNLLFRSIAEGSCLLNLDAQHMDEIIEAAVTFLVQTGRLPEHQEQMVISGLLERERAVPTVIGHACAVPHFYNDAIAEPAMVFVRLTHAANLGAPDGIPTRYVYLLIGSTEQTARHLDTLSSIARLMSDNVVHFEMMYAKSQQDILDAMERHVNRNVLAAPPKPREVTEGLTSPPQLFAGLKADIRRRIPHYLDDIRDGIRAKTLAAIIFMFFACLAPAVTFGGLMGIETGGDIGAAEMLMSTAVCGLIYAVLAGQPLIILGGIGPLLIFTIILYQICVDMGQKNNFLGIYGWIGLWTSLITIVLAVTNASNLMRYFTRFTDEIFSALMSLIFIYKAVQALAQGFQETGDGTSSERALLALVLALGTFYIAMTLARFRNSIYLFPWMREFLADFGPSIALVCMIALAWWLGDATTLDTLDIGHVTDSTSGTSAWIVNFGAVPYWIRFAAIGPAILAAVLIFLSQNITARLVNSPQNRLNKGESYHLDLAVVGGLVGLCSLFGWPWMVAATVRSLAHVRSLAVVEEVIGPGGPAQRDHPCRRESNQWCRNPFVDRRNLARAAAAEVRAHGRALRHLPVHGLRLAQRGPIHSATGILADGFSTLPNQPLHAASSHANHPSVHARSIDLPRGLVLRQHQSLQTGSHPVPNFHRAARPRSCHARTLFRQGPLGLSRRRRSPRGRRPTLALTNGWNVCL